MSGKQLEEFIDRAVTAELLPYQLNRGLPSRYPNPTDFISLCRKSLIDRIYDGNKRQEYERDLQRLVKLIYGDRAGKIEVDLNPTKVLLIPIIGFGLAAALTAVNALNSLPLGRLANGGQDYETRQGIVAGMSQGVMVSPTEEQCFEAEELAKSLSANGNPLGFEVYEYLRSTSCKQ
jgi:hypothetical protein